MRFHVTTREKRKTRASESDTLDPARETLTSHDNEFDLDADRHLFMHRLPIANPVIYTVPNDEHERVQT
jgi:hypothetical protein